MYYATEALGPDGLPMIEVLSVTMDRDNLQLGGTASVYEGTVLVEILAGEEVVYLFHGTATAGAPARGRWQVQHQMPDAFDQIRVLSEPMDGEGGAQTSVCIAITETPM